MSLKTQLLADGPLFVDPAVFGETITYTQGAVTTTLNAVVQRGDTEKITSIGGRSFPGNVIQLEIPVASMPLIKERFDSVHVTLRPGDVSPTKLRITKIREQDEGMWTLEAEV